MIHERMLIGGKWVRSKNGDVMEVVNPAAGEVFAEVPLAGKSDVEDAINAADSVFSSWSRMTPFERGKYLRRPVNWF